MKTPLKAALVAVVTIVALGAPMAVADAQAQNTGAQFSSELRGKVSAIATELARLVAEGETIENALEAFWSEWPVLVLQTTAEAIAAESSPVGVGILTQARAVRQTAREDKQLGADSSGGASTTLVDKAGIPEFLALAIENGVISEERSGTKATLRTTPYAFIKWGAGDTAENYTRYGLWRRVGLAASFALNSERAITAADINEDQLTDWSVKVRLIGDRSARSAAFTELWIQKIQPAYVSALSDYNRALIAFWEATDSTEFTAMVDAVEGATEAAEASNLTVMLTQSLGNVGADRPGTESALTEAILSTLESRIWVGAQDRSVLDDDSARRAIVEEILPSWQDAAARLTAAERKTAGDLLDDFNEQPLLTFQYANVKADASVTRPAVEEEPMETMDAAPDEDAMQTMDSDAGEDTMEAPMLSTPYSEIKAVYQQGVDPFEIILNANMSFYHDPELTMGAGRIRDYGFGFSLEGSVDNGLTNNGGDTNDQSTIEISFSGKFSWFEGLAEGLQRDFGDNDNKIVLQGKVDIPLAKGLVIPIAFTADRVPDRLGSDGSEKAWDSRLQFGLSFDFDKLNALTQGALR